MRFEIVKCHGSGNDFPLIDARGIVLSDDEWAAVARALADRRGPVGGDGLLLLLPGSDDAAFAMSMRNSDGSEAETCLNGLRCVARMGFAATGVAAAVVTLKTSIARVERADDVAAGVYGVRETAGPASLDSAAWPADLGTDAPVIDAVIPAMHSDRRFTAVAMPNPHLVTFVDAIDEHELVALGERCEAAPPWLPRRANVSFVRVLGSGRLFVRTFERGVGLTDSCGSAMAASTYAACLSGRMAFGDELMVLNRGGLVKASASAEAMVTIVGNATWEWQGSIEVDLAREIAGALTVTRHFNDEIAAWAAVAEAARVA
ncbi:diaminopimelate epimerase [Sphingomonas oligophenolica]|uniref:Diaminopimelate epimerase n=1 Tax=Sphingomonas oligophenolica TaxID=301154 RepID=A0A502CBH7_9SPHN|nr:diaminopimelate epimerase [Sphingomonas oligophenolica]TPG09964.1 diaminopimelate epimerase [Sphingomonas oligophenolica]